MAWSRDLITVRASILLTFAVATLSIVVGLVHISTGGVDSAYAQIVPPAIRRTVGFTGTLTGFTMLAGAWALRNRYRIGWYVTVVLLPITAAQGLLQVSPFAVPLVVLSIVSIPALVYNRSRFNRNFSPSMTQVAASLSLVTAVAYGTLGSYALREEFSNLNTITDAFYYTIVTASTVGYGDITPESELGLLFGISVLVLNVSAFAVALGVLLTPAIEAQLSKALGRMTESQFNLLDDHILILGDGDLTEPIIEHINNGTDFAIVTTNEPRARRYADHDYPVLTADPSDEEPLVRVGITDARAAIVATENDAQDALAILTARQLNPDLTILAAATQRENVAKLRRAGADRVISPAMIGGRLLASSAIGGRDAEDASEQLLGGD